MGAIESVSIFDPHNTLLLSHTYNARPPSPTSLLSTYTSHPAPRPSLIYAPPTLLFSSTRDNLLFLASASHDLDPLLVLEWLHRLADALEEFLGAPLIATGITSNYHVVAQVLAEMADAGIPCQSEGNALRDTIETGPGVLGNLLGKVGLPASGTAPSSGSSNGPSSLLPQTSSAPAVGASAIPWRRSAVRHTHNELYVDLLETLSIVLAPSGRPLSAFAYGSIAFTSQVSGVPDLLLTLTPGDKGAGMGTRGEKLRKVMERTVWHPCVRLNRWKEEGVLSFVPPDGKFVLGGYEVDLLGPDQGLSSNSTSKDLGLPVSIEVTTALGANGNEFEVRLLPQNATNTSSRASATASLQSNLNSRPTPFKSSSSSDASKPSIPALEDLVVTIPLPVAGIRNVSDLRASRGDAQWNPATGDVEWKISATAKDGLPSSGTVLRCTVQSHDSGAEGQPINGFKTTTYDYSDDDPSNNEIEDFPAPTTTRTMQKPSTPMPTTALLSFTQRGQLASGIRVESLLLDAKKSRGLGNEVRPYKGVKYGTVSRRGVEWRC